MSLYHNLLFPNVLIRSLLWCCFCIIFLVSINEGGSFTFNLIHRDSPLSPSYNPHATLFEHRKSMFNRSLLRKRKMSLSLLKSSKLIKSAIYPAGYGSYLMKINLGTPPIKQIVSVDTTSDLTWIQCRPCSECYSQNFPLFNPENSTTFEALSCMSKQCSLANLNSFCGRKNHCNYVSSYRTNYYSIGNLSMETFTFDSTSGGSISFPKVVFGCGFENVGGADGMQSGTIGLGDGAVSLIRQLDNVTVGKFSYCLTSLEANNPSKISFGNDAIVTGPKAKSTPLLQKPPNNFYFITLEGISVGTTRLEYKSHPMSTSFDKGNMAIDTGFSLTFLPVDLYNDVDSALRDAIRANPVREPNSYSNLCYHVADENGNPFVPPSITAHFTNADLVLPHETTFMEMENGVACLTLMPSADFGFFGNLHQINYLVGFDLVNGMISFLPTDCSKHV